MGKKVLLAVVVAILVFSSAFATYSAYNDLKPKKVTVKRNVTIGTYELYYDYYSTVSKENPLWGEGMKLFNKDVYFSSVSPVLNITFNLILPESNFEVEYETKLLITSSTSDKVFWELERVIGSGVTVLNSSKFSYSFSLNILELEREIESIERSLEFKGGSKTIKVVTNVYAKGSEKEIKDSVEMTIKPSGSYYTVSSSGKKKTVERTVNEVKKVPPSQREYIFALSKVALPILGIIASVYVYRISSLSEDEKALRKFRKWISKGKLPEVRMTTIEIESLEDLVDAAIDMNERVIHDAEKNAFFFVHDGILYIYKGKARQGEEET
ncbi:hypothetical protein Ferp_1702 [Ferroglobus placidus DSM 10642]|uniref:DUF5305 domain-containing protein n=1 Tax=Ferroglobus placidus (strain DSM 10642 / AEDII12DO) TaxID=589924 RepID=D3RZD3_FERPA|nr:DUF5305 domain-containing protein [Ferroglobus placidus]ADC65846.1 hypothetical protein Ferp_1702 [Ferroglobus placidus DSM 10642]